LDPPREDILKEQLERATRDIVKQVVPMRDIFKIVNMIHMKLSRTKQNFL
jgi:hypothetical protein